MGQIWEQTQRFRFHFLLDVGTFVERLWNVCSFIVLTLLICMLTHQKKGWVEGQTAAVAAYAFQCLIIRKGQADTVL